jgi:hypothetical protein
MRDVRSAASRTLHGVADLECPRSLKEARELLDLAVAKEETAAIRAEGRKSH